MIKLYLMDKKDNILEGDIEVPDPNDVGGVAQFLIDEWCGNHPYQGVRKSLKVRIYVGGKLALTYDG